MRRARAPSGARPATTLATLGARLRHARHTRALTQAQLAARAGVEQTTVSKLETDRHRRADATTLARLARALAVAPTWLRDGIGAPPTPGVLPAPQPPAAATPTLAQLDATLDEVFDPSRHRATDVACLRSLLQDHVHALLAATPPPTVRTAMATWLDAVHALRAEGHALDFTGVVLRALAATPASGPSAVAPPRTCVPEETPEEE